MAHFMKPHGCSDKDYDVDNKFGPGSVWRVRIPLGGTRTVAVVCSAGLTVTSDNASVVPPDRLRELAPWGDWRIFELFGANPGASGIEVRGSDNSVWARLQVQVGDGSAVPGPGVPRNTWALNDSPKAVRDLARYAGADRIVPVPINSRPIATSVRGLAIHVTAGENNAESVVKNTWKSSGVAAHFITELSSWQSSRLTLLLWYLLPLYLGRVNPHEQC